MIYQIQRNEEDNWAITLIRKKYVPAANNSYSSMPALQPAANSLQANTLGEFAGTAYSQPLAVIRKKIKFQQR